MRELLFILTTSAGTVTLNVSPDGWDESMITWERSDKYWGVFRSWTIPLKFVKDGAEAIRREFYTNGTGGVGDITIQKLDKVTLMYSNAYVGKLDYGTFKDSDYSVEVNFLDGGLAKILKDNGGTEYEVMARSYGSTDYILFTTATPSDADTFGGINITDLIKKMLDRMTDGGYTDGTYGFKSDLLTAMEAGTDHDILPVIVAKGQTFRQPNMSPQGNFKTTIEDIFKSLSPWASSDNTGVGLGIETIEGKETLVIENRSYFFSNSSFLDVGEVKSISVSVSAKLQWNKLKIGFPAKEYQNFDIAREAVAESYWKSPNDTNSTELDMISKYRADGYGIYDQITEQSDGIDDDIFFVMLSWTENYGGRWEHLQMSEGRFTGYPGTTWPVSNAPFTPRRCLLTVQKWLESCLYNYPTGIIEYTSGSNDQYSIEVREWIPGSGFQAYMKERDDVTLSPPSLFLPLNIDIETALPADMITHLNADNTKLITFSFEGNTYSGFVMSVKAKLSGRGAQKITLLSSATNIITNLIR